ncbi:MAG: ABC transporter ATP-binding protein [Spirochaetota bacterium]|nr:ABC transporter ATP-binding protein [Spirochaetota bacterium]
MLTLNNLSLTITNNHILKNITVEFFEGEIIGIIGKPGCGKSVLLQTIAQYYTHYNGEILLNTKPIRLIKKRELSQKISYQPAGYFYNHYITLYDYLVSSRIPYKTFLSPFQSFDYEIVDKYMHHFELQQYKFKPLVLLSSDIQARALLAFHFIRQAQIVLLDNPTHNLSLPSYNQLHDAIIRYCSTGKNCCIIASHDINFLAQTVDKLYIMENGSIVDSCIPADLTEDLIKNIFGVDVFITRNIYNGKPNIHLYFAY